MYPDRAPARWFGAFVVSFLLEILSCRDAVSATPDYAGVDAILRRACLDCHAAQEPEGGLILESHPALMKGGKSGPVVHPGRSAVSSLVIAVEAGLLVDGKRRVMPPGKREKLKPDEIALLKTWIDAGAPGPSVEGTAAFRELAVPKVSPFVPAPRAIRAAAWSGSLRQLALGRPGEVELVTVERREVIRRLSPIRGAVNALAFSEDGRRLVVAAGEPARLGEATIWDATDGRLLRSFPGHTDALYALALSPDAGILATGGYDQKVKIWKVESGELRHTLSAHNAAIFGLAFRPDGRVLASASADRTVKLWQTSSGKRVETLSQPLKEVQTLVWSADGRRLAAAGADHRIRVWDVSESAAETTNPLLTSKFAHEGAILALAWSRDGRTLVSAADDLMVKIWDASSFTERRTLERQPDLAPALSFLGDSARVVVGRLDGSWEIYDVATGAVVRDESSAKQPHASAEIGGTRAAAVPVLNRVEPRGIGPGMPTVVSFFGSNLDGVTNLNVASPGLRLGLLSATSGVVRALAEAVVSGLPGPYEVRVVGPGGTSGPIKIHVESLRVVEERRATNVLVLPVAIWGALERSAELDAYRFGARSNQVVILELATKSVESKLQNGMITLHDASGGLLASAGGFDGGDRILSHRIPRDSVYSVRVSDQMLTASSNHFYRLSVGELPVVTGVYPLTVPTNLESVVTLAGHHLPAALQSVRVRSGDEGVESAVAVSGTGLRGVKPFRVLAVGGSAMQEQEPNDRPAQANSLNWPGSMNGRLARASDEDWFRFQARRGQRLMVETVGARLGAPVDTRVELRDRAGQPVPRLKLQAVRNTAVNFRGVDSNNTGMRLDHYEEMELNEYLYLNGDVMRLFRMPQGPDSDMMMYASAGKRRAYFDTTAVGHTLDEVGFIVEPHALDAKLAPSGLPIFTLFYENDDDGRRQWGADSRLSFEPPADGEYLVRVTDTRGLGSEDAIYALVIREAHPGYRVSLSGTNLTLAPGSGQGFTVAAERIDGFEGEIRVDISGLPPGLSVSTPLVIEAGHDEAKGTLFAAAELRPADLTNAALTRITASANVDGRTVTRDAGSLGQIKLGPAPKLYVHVEADRDPTDSTSGVLEGDATSPTSPMAAPLELTIEAGGTIPAWLKIRRNGHQDLVTFFAENLPHGVIVADIGLSGVLIPKDENERRIFFNAARWVRPQERLFHLIEQQAGRQTSRPIRLKVLPARK